MAMPVSLRSTEQPGDRRQDRMAAERSVPEPNGLTGTRLRVRWLGLRPSGVSPLPPADQAQQRSRLAVADPQGSPRCRAQAERYRWKDSWKSH